MGAGKLELAGAGDTEHANCQRTMQGIHPRHQEGLAEQPCSNMGMDSEQHQAVLERATRLEMPATGVEEKDTITSSPFHSMEDQQTTEVNDKTTNTKKRKFNVMQALRSLQPEHLRVLVQEIKILTLNLRGLRTKYKRESIKELACQLKFTVGIFTETHLLNSEDHGLEIPGYTVLHREGISRHMGGVLILVDTNLACKKITDIQMPPKPIDVCSCIIYPLGREEYQIRVTAIYVPPSAKATPEMLATITGPEHQTQLGELGHASHLIVGDLNPNTWKSESNSKYYEWLAEAGLWELSDPMLPTFERKSAVDKFLLLPGADIPEEWMLECAEQDGTEETPGDSGGEMCYPAVTLPDPWIGDHHPLILGMNGVMDEADSDDGQQRQLYRVRDLRPEDWLASNTKLESLLLGSADRLAHADRTANVTRFLDILMGDVKEALGEHCRKNKKRDGGTGAAVPHEPFREFCAKNKGHPEYPVLMKAIIDSDQETATQTMQRMSRDGWRKYLASVHPTDTSSFFLYLARAEGRKPKKSVYPCMAPIRDGKGRLHLRGKEKCEVLADYFERRLNPTTAPESGSHAKRKGKTGRPMGYRRQMTGQYEPIREVEVSRAILGLTKKKAAGDDGMVAEVFQGLPCLLKPLTRLFNLILHTGRIPYPMLKVIMVPLDKPRRNPEECRSKRPISLIPVLSKIMEGVILHRLMLRWESRLDAHQYAYRRERGTEMHLLELSDFVREARDRGQYVYIAAIDVASAFDNVAHSRLVRTLEDSGVDTYICRFVHNWLGGRIFRLRLATPNGCFFSSWRRIAQGVPQGGILSPFLWLMHMDPFSSGVKRQLLLPADGLGEVRVCVLVYADDVICALAHENLRVIETAAEKAASACEGELGSLGLGSESDKSENLLLEPNFGEDGIFRRHATGLGAGGTERPAIQPQRIGEQADALRTAHPNVVLPYKVVTGMRVLGVFFDNRFCFQKQLESILDRSRVRMAIVKRVSGCTWGLETSMLRLTGDALVVSLLRYGLATIGSGLEKKGMDRVDKRVVNVLSRMVLGVSRTARLPILHAASGVLTMNNLFTQHCAAMVDLALRAHNSSLRERLLRWTSRVYGMSGWEVRTERVSMDPPLLPRVGELRYLDFDIQESWLAQMVDSEPELEQRLRVPMVFHTNASEIRTQPQLLAGTYDYRGVSSWFEVGIQVLAASGWRPDRAQAMSLNAARTLPPIGQRGPIIIETSETMRYIGESGDEGCRAWMENPENGYRVTTGVFFQDSVGASCASQTMPGGLPGTQGWIIGEDRVSEDPPVSVLEAGVLHALLLVEQATLSLQSAPAFFLARTGNGRICDRLREWFNSGRLRLQSSFAADIVSVLHRLADTLTAPLIIIPVRRGFFEGVKARGVEDCDLIHSTAVRLYSQVVPKLKAQLGSRLAKIPWTAMETKKNCKIKLRRDELKVINLLEAEGSVACSIYRHLDITRDMVKIIFRKFQHSRKHQVVFASIICATRFKQFDSKGSLRSAKCFRCGGEDSITHLLECSGVGSRLALIPVNSEDQMVDFLYHLVREAARHAPVWPRIFESSPAVD